MKDRVALKVYLQINIPTRSNQKEHGSNKPLTVHRVIILRNKENYSIKSKIYLTRKIFKTFLI